MFYMYKVLADKSKCLSWPFNHLRLSIAPYWLIFQYFILIATIPVEENLMIWWTKNYLFNGYLSSISKPCDSVDPKASIVWVSPSLKNTSLALDSRSMVFPSGKVTFILPAVSVYTI